jgi:hypothetical protein
VAPGTTPGHTLAALVVDMHGLRSFWILILILAPFPDIPRHIHRTLFRSSTWVHTDSGCPMQLTFQTITPVHIPFSRPGILAHGSASRSCLLPLPLSGQANLRLGPVTEPATKGHGIAPGRSLTWGIGFLPRGDRRLLAPLDALPPFLVSIAILSGEKRLELRMGDWIFSHAKWLHLEQMIDSLQFDLPPGMSIQAISGKPSGRRPTPGRGSPNSASLWPINRRFPWDSLC